MRYKILSRIENKGRLYGFQCVDTNSKILNLAKIDIDKLIESNSIDINKNKRGYYFKDNRRSISRLPVVSLYGIKAEINKKETIDLSTGKIWTGDRLRKYTDDLVYSKEVSKIDTVKDFLDISRDTRSQVLCITGMKRTGKSVMMVQSIKALIKHGISDKEIILIQYDDEAIYEDEMERLAKLLVNSDYKYIFIDEITMLSRFTTKVKSITDNVATQNKKVVLSGSDTLVFILARWQTLVGRYVECSMTMTSYKDWVNILSKNKGLYLADKQKNVRDYIEDCTLNRYGLYKSNEAMYDYIMDSMAENILRSFKKNIDSGRVKNISYMDNDKIMFIMYKICYDVIHHRPNSFSKDGWQMKKEIKSILLNLGINVDKENRGKLQNKVLRALGIDNNIINSSIEKEEYDTVLRLMEEVGLIRAIGIERYTKSKEGDTGLENSVEYYLTIPSIYNRFLIATFKVLVGKQIKRGDLLKKEYNSLYGNVIESIVVTHVADYIDNVLGGSSIDDMCKLQIGIEKFDTEQDIEYVYQREIDLFIEKDSKSGLRGCAYDVKMSDKLNNEHFKAFKHWFREMFPDIVATGNIGIVYMGDTTVYKDMKAINIHDFLMDIGKYI